MDLGIIRRLDEVRGFVEEDPGCVVRGARPIDADDRKKLLEQRIEQLLREGRG